MKFQGQGQATNASQLESGVCGTPLTYRTHFGPGQKGRKYEQYQPTNPKQDQSAQIDSCAYDSLAGFRDDAGLAGTGSVKPQSGCNSATGKAVWRELWAMERPVVAVGVLYSSGSQPIV